MIRSYRPEYGQLTIEYMQRELNRIKAFADEVSAASETALSWVHPYTGQCVPKNTQVFDNPFTMVSNTNTCDRAAPQPVGVPSWTLSDTPTWNTLSHTGIVYGGLRISGLTTLYEVTNYRAWISSLSPTVIYRLVAVDNDTQRMELGAPIQGDKFSATGWNEMVGSGKWIGPGTDVSIFLMSQDVSTTTDYDNPYNYIGDSNQENDPGAGNVERRGDNSTVRVSHTDSGAGDRQAELNALIAGSIVKIIDAVDATQYLEYQVISTTDEGVWQSISVNLLSEGTGGEPSNGAVRFTSEIPVAAAVDYVEELGSYSGAAHIQGVLQLDEGAPVYSSQGHGIDITFQEYSVSPDWNLSGYSG